MDNGNFSGCSLLLWNGKNAGAYTQVSPDGTTMTAQIPATDIQNPGFYSIQVFNGGNSLSSNPLSFMVPCPDGSSPINNACPAPVIPPAPPVTPPTTPVTPPSPPPVTPTPPATPPTSPSQTGPVISGVSATPNPVTGTQTILAVTAQGTGLTYNWTVPPSAAVTLKDAFVSNPQVTFSAGGAGSYQFNVTVTDSQSLTASGSVTVNVVQTLSSIFVDSPPGTVEINVPAKFTAVPVDQWDQPLSPAPTIIWTTDAGASIDASGNFTAATAGGHSVTASAGGINGSASIIVSAAMSAPVITQPAGPLNAQLGLFLTYAITATNCPCQFGASTPWPAGFSINSQTGLISGSATTLSPAPGTPVTITATNTHGTGTATLFFIVTPGASPPATMSIGTVQGVAGNSVTIPIQLSPGPAPVAGLQFSMTVPSALTYVSISAGTASQTAQKEVVGAVNGTTLTAIIVGLNSNSLGSGTVAVIQFQISASASGTLPLHLFGAIASDPLGKASPFIPSDGTLVITGAGNALATPVLPLADTLPVDGEIAVVDPSQNSVTFEWGIAPESAVASLASANRALGTSNPVMPYSTTSHVLQLAPLNLSPGRYLVTVEAVDDLGNHSVPAQADVTLVSLASSALSSMRVYPNPWRADRPTAFITFDNMTVNSTVKIFTIAGQWVRTLSAPDGSVSWNLKNDSGNAAASGLYFYLVTDGQGGRSRGQLGIIR